MFANELADGIAKRYPSALDSQPAKRPSTNRLTRIMEETCRKAVDYKVAENLGWMERARLANDFRWALVELGYTKEFVDFATEAITIHLGRKS